MYWSLLKVNVKQLNVILVPNLHINLKSILICVLLTTNTTATCINIRHNKNVNNQTFKKGHLLLQYKSLRNSYICTRDVTVVNDHQIKTQLILWQSCIQMSKKILIRNTQNLKVNKQSSPVASFTCSPNVNVTDTWYWRLSLSLMHSMMPRKSWK